MPVHGCGVRVLHLSTKSHSWAANNFGNETKRAIGMGAYTAIGNMGSIAGSWFYPSTDAPLYHKGHYLVGFLIVSVRLS